VVLSSGPYRATVAKGYCAFRAPVPGFFRGRDRRGWCRAAPFDASLPFTKQQFPKVLPLPHGQGSLRGEPPGAIGFPLAIITDAGSLAQSLPIRSDCRISRARVNFVPAVSRARARIGAALRGWRLLKMCRPLLRPVPAGAVYSGGLEIGTSYAADQSPYTAGVPLRRRSAWLKGRTRCRGNAATWLARRDGRGWAGDVLDGCFDDGRRRRDPFERERRGIATAGRTVITSATHVTTLLVTAARNGSQCQTYIDQENQASHLSTSVNWGESQTHKCATQTRSVVRKFAINIGDCHV
jgi:hypothetical protein